MIYGRKEATVKKKEASGAEADRVNMSNYNEYFPVLERGNWE
jgi:hypothetical protein